MVQQIKKLLTGCLLLAMVFTDAIAQDHDLKLWYNEPAGKVWEAAMPIGNGRLAAMVFGNPANETIQLNEGTVWSGSPNRNDNPDALAALPEVRKLLFEDKYEEASKLAAQKIQSKRNNGMKYQPVGDLNLSFPGHETYSNYYRELDLETATTKTRYTVNGITYERTVFASIPDQAIIVHLTASKPNSLGFNASLSSPQKPSVTMDGNDELVLTGISGDKEGVPGKVKFEALAKIKIDGGQIKAVDNEAKITNANSVTIYISIATNYVNYHDISASETARAQAYLQKALQKDYTQLLKDHIAGYQRYFNRVSINLGKTDSVKNPTNIRLNQFANDNDPQLVALYFQFGRYLLNFFFRAGRPACYPARHLE